MTELNYIKVLCVDGIDEVKTGETYLGCLIEECECKEWVIKGVSNIIRPRSYLCPDCHIRIRATFNYTFKHHRLIPLEDSTLEAELRAEKEAVNV